MAYTAENMIPIRKAPKVLVRSNAGVAGLVGIVEEEFMIEG